MSLASYSIDQEAITQAKPDKPPGQDKKGDDDAFQDMPLLIDFFAGELHSSSLPLRDSDRGITVFAGRRWGIVLEIQKNISNPYLILNLGDRLTDNREYPGDPNPAADGPDEGDFGNYLDFAPEPILDPTGRIYEPRFMVGERVPIKDSLAISIDTGAKLYFKDAMGQTYHLFWGPDAQPGGAQRTNPLAPPVTVYRRHAEGESPRNWDVYTNADSSDRYNKHTAFLWLLSKGWTLDYCGAYDVSFSYHAEEE
ncbi:MAG: hypothetical protein PVI66_06115 [Candidatus Aminicenantes bacterium]